MEDMEKDTVDFVPNYDERLTEPTVFPAAFPNLLVNGGTGIAVGMATNMPPHNLGEVIDGICAQIDNPEITVEQLMQHIKGPDFPTGCTICGLAGIKEYFTTGRGSVKMRGKVGLEEIKGGREQIVITAIPYNVNRAVLVERIAELVNEKVITDITAVRDESDENTRVVIEIKRDALPKVVINNLYQHTALETSFAVNAARHRSRPAQDPRPEGRSSIATSSTGAKSSSGGRALNCARRRSAPKRWKASSSRCPTWTNSSASSANPATARRRKIKLLAFDFTRAASRAASAS